MFKRLVELRKEKKLSQSKVAEILDITRQTYSKIENGDNDLSLGQAVKLADYFDVSVESFISDSEDVKVELGEETKLEKYKELILAFIKFGSDDDGKIPKTKLAKLCYLADFAWFYKHVEPMIGLKYRKNHHGPVPDTYFSVLEELEEEEGIIKENKNKTQLISSTGDISYKHLSVEELDLIQDISIKWKGKNTQAIVDFTHAQLPWTLVEMKDFIDYDFITQEDPDNVY